mmetsp:Transcript_15003/g.28159  ORF Transcript_15003/g.28159 Transcript_15003/m.28159 type:complete len:90 (-) Transcript_15003:24-293(-)
MRSASSASRKVMAQKRWMMLQRTIENLEEKLKAVNAGYDDKPGETLLRAASPLLGKLAAGRRPQTSFHGQQEAEWRSACDICRSSGRRS